MVVLGLCSCASTSRAAMNGREYNDASKDAKRKLYIVGCHLAKPTLNFGRERVQHDIISAVVNLDRTSRTLDYAAFAGVVDSTMTCAN